MSLSDFFDLLSFVWLSIWAIVASRSILCSQKYSVSFLILTHFVFSGLPAILNVLLSHPLYLLFRKYQLLQDTNVDALYTCYICACPPIWWYFGRPNGTRQQTIAAEPKNTSKSKIIHRFRFLLYLLACSPLLAVCLSPEPSFYISYAAVINSPMSDAMTSYQSWVTASTTICLFAIAGIWATCKRIFVAFLTCLPLLSIAVWVNGKRNIVLMAIGITLMVFWNRRTLTGWKLAIAALLAIIGFAAYSYSYQNAVRSANALTAAVQYDNFRIDYGRDHVIKYAIYCELHPEEQPILEYRGESLLFYLSMYVPRVAWPDKPWPYAVYSTSAALGREPEDLGWGITTSLLEESVANFSFLGFIIGPLLLAAFCRFGDNSQNGLCRFLTIVIACLSLTVQLSAFTVIAATWLLAVLTVRFFNRFASKKKLVTVPAV